MISSKTIANGILRAIGILAAVLLSLYFIFLVQTVIVYVIISIIFALIANPIVEFLRRKFKFSNTIAVVTTMFIFVVLLVGLFSLFVPLIISQSDNLSLLDTKAVENRSVELYGKINTYLLNHNVDLSRIVKESDLTSKDRKSVV